MLDKLKTDYVFWIMVGISVGMFILAYAITPKKQAITCKQYQQELAVVTDIARATGRLPGNPVTQDPKTEYKITQDCSKELSVKEGGDQLEAAGYYLQPTELTENLQPAAGANVL